MPESRMSDYDTDILIWSERQGELLRRAASPASRSTMPRRTGRTSPRGSWRWDGATAVLPIAVAPGAPAQAESRGLAALPRCPDLAG
jgi:hypothetical protein